MEQESKEAQKFEKSMKKVNRILSVVGLNLNENDINRTVKECLRNRLFFLFNITWFNSAISLQISWFIESLIIHRSIVEIVYFLPCLTMCLLGDLKAYCFIKYSHQVNDLVLSLKKLQTISSEKTQFRDEVEEELLKKREPLLNTATNILLIVNVLGLVAFGTGPLILIGLKYQATGVLELYLPFLLWYPFNALDIKVWPFIYVHQMWAAVHAVFMVIGPDGFLSMCCTFIHVQFRCLQYDIERINVNSDQIDGHVDNFLQIKSIVDRHRELIRCVELLEIIFTKSTLFNVATSSLIICGTGFTVTTIDNYALMAPFLAFLTMSLIQIFLFCYYGDLMMQSSMEVSDAVYKSQWYKGDVKLVRDMLLISIRSRRPCKLTACGFADINLSTFSRITGTAWSYFTLLKTVYRD